MSSCKDNKGENMCIIDEIVLGKIVDLVCKKIGEAISNAKWKELFVSTGEFIIKSPDKLDCFTKDLSVVFSKKNLLELSKKMKNRSGFEFSETLYNEFPFYTLIVKMKKHRQSKDKTCAFFEQRCFLPDFCIVIFSFIYITKRLSEKRDRHIGSYNYT